MGLGIDILQVGGFPAHRRAEVHDLAVDFLAVVVDEAHLILALNYAKDRTAGRSHRR